METWQKIIKMTGSKSKLIFEPSREDDPFRRLPDISLAKEKLNGWEPKVDIETGLQTTINYFKEIL